MPTSLPWHAANFYPRSPCGERPLAPEENPTQKRISIHALLAESDLTDDVSTGGKIISIHALLAESDPCILSYSEVIADFYPRSPCGERLFGFCEGVLLLRISIHALLAESDLTS